MNIKLFIGWAVAVWITMFLLRVVCLLILAFIWPEMPLSGFKSFMTEGSLIAAIVIATLWLFRAQDQKAPPIMVTRPFAEDEAAATIEKARHDIIEMIMGTDVLWRERDFNGQLVESLRILVGGLIVSPGVAIGVGLVLIFYVVIFINPEGCLAHGVTDASVARATMSAEDFARFCPDEAWTDWIFRTCIPFGLIGGVAIVLGMVLQRESKICRLRVASYEELRKEYEAWKAARLGAG